MSWKPPFPVVKLPDCQQNFDSLQRKFPLDTEDIAPGAVILDTQRAFGTNAAYAAFGNGTNVTVNGAGTILLSLTITPPVDCWWEVHTSVPLIQKADAVWNYCQLVQKLTVADVEGHIAKFVATSSCHNALPFTNLEGTTLWKLAAGTTYTAFATFTATGAGWTYYQGSDYLHMHGKAWPR